MICFRLLDSDDPAEPLAQAVAKVCEGENPPSVYSVNPTSFHKVPNAPFAYWVSEDIRGLFAKLPAFEGNGRYVRVGLQSSDDFRFVRSHWETASQPLKWYPFAKGGSYAPFYGPINLQFDWGKNGNSVKAWIASQYTSWSKRVQNSKFYFRPGLTWTVFARSPLSTRILPRGCILSHVGGAAFSDTNSELGMLLLTSSKLYRFWLFLAGVSDVGRRVFGAGPFAITPFVDVPQKRYKIARSAWSLRRSTDTANQTSHAFYAPALTPRRTKPLSTHSS